MIIDVTVIELTPGNSGIDCKGNGAHFDKSGNLYECCCDECDYMLCCIDENNDLLDYVNLYGLEGKPDCRFCTNIECPRNNTNNTAGI